MIVTKDNKYLLTEEEKMSLIKKYKGKSLLQLKPELSIEWCYDKNGDLTPEMVGTGSELKVWWRLKYKNHDNNFIDLDWIAPISRRTHGKGCPYLCGKAILIGFNDLTSTHPEIAAQWHPTKNNGLRPTDVTAGSNKKIWWYLPYDDLHTGKHFDFEWVSSVCQRTMHNLGCPFLSNSAVWVGYNDFQTIHPELSKYWHPVKNGNLKPTDVIATSGIKVWWQLTHYDIRTNKYFTFEWEASVCAMTNGATCPYLTNSAVWQGFNDLATTHPELAAEWHPTKNNELKPTDIVAGCMKKVWWYLPYNDPHTGKFYNFEWQATVNSRTQGSGCPYLSGKSIWKGYNDLATKNPELAKEWHPIKNGNLTPSDIQPQSSIKVWWYLPYNDIKTGKHFVFEWQATVSHRSNGSGCPYLTNDAVWAGYNDLATTHPQLAAEWHSIKNGVLKPTDVTAGSEKKVWWVLHYNDPKTGEHHDYEWQATVYNRVKGKGCPYIKSSKTEMLICNFLKAENMSFDVEWKMKTNSKQLFRFDIFISPHKLMIECDGEQHFRPIKHFGGTKKFNQRKINDNIKNDFCKSQNIPLLRIPYIYDPVVDKDKIEKFVLDFIQTKQVPQEIIEFYAKHPFSNYCK